MSHRFIQPRLARFTVGVSAIALAAVLALTNSAGSSFAASNSPVTTQQLQSAPATASQLGAVVPDGSTLSVTPSGSLKVISTPPPVLGEFTCDGSTVQFNLNAVPTAASKITVTIGGVVQVASGSFAAYTISSATLILNTPCLNTSPPTPIEVRQAP